jgi:hypothetical protein
MLVRADDFLAFKDRYQDGFSKLQNSEAAQIFDRLVEGIQSRLVITDAGGAVEWLQETLRARAAISGGMRGVAPAFIEHVAKLATKYGRLTGPVPVDRQGRGRVPEVQHVQDLQGG